MLSTCRKTSLLLIYFLVWATFANATDSESDDDIFSNVDKCKSYEGDTNKEFESVKFTPFDYSKLEMVYDTDMQMYRYKNVLEEPPQDTLKEEKPETNKKKLLKNLKIKTEPKSDNNSLVLVKEKQSATDNLNKLSQNIFTKNPSLAKKYLKETASESNPKACYLMGKLCVSEGKEAEAVKWYKIAADKKYIPACEVYSAMLIKGERINKNPEGAKKYLKYARKLDLSEKLIYSNFSITLEELTILIPFTNLTSLNLYYNNIDDDGAKTLSPLTNLTSLNLWNNEIGVAGAKTLSALTNLTFLNLENNNISDPTIENIQKQIEKNKQRKIQNK